MLKKSVLLLSLSMLLGVAPLLSTRRPQLPLRHTSDSSFEELLERLYRDLPENVRDELLSLLGAASLFTVLMWIFNRNERPAPAGNVASSLSAAAASATGLGLSFGSNLSGRDAGLPNSRDNQAGLGAADRLVVPVAVAATQGQLGVQAEMIRADPIVAQLRASAQVFEEAQHRREAESLSSASSTRASSRESDQTRERTQEYENSMDPIIAQIRASEQALRNAQQSHQETQSSSSSGISANSTQDTSESNLESDFVDREATRIMVRRILAHYFSMRSTQSTMNSQSFNQFFEQALNRAVDSCLADIRQFRSLGWNGNVRELMFFVTETSVGVAIIVLPPDEVNSNVSCSCSNCLKYQEISKEARRRMVTTKGENRLIARLGQLAVYSHTGVTRNEIYEALRSLVDSRIDARLIEQQLEQSIINQPIIQSALRDVYGRLVDQAVVIISSRLEIPEVEIEEEEHDLSIYLPIERELDDFLGFVTRVSHNLAQSHTIDLSSFLSKKK